jgi:hypothetical protein
MEQPSPDAPPALVPAPHDLAAEVRESLLLLLLLGLTAGAAVAVALLLSTIG